MSQRELMRDESLAPGAPLPSVRHELFCQHIANGSTAQAAFKAAGFSGNGSDYSRVSKLPSVAARVQHLLGEKLALVQVTGDRVKRELSRIAFADVRRLFDANGALLPPHMLDDDTAATIASIQVEVVTRGRGDEAEEVVIKKIKMAPKMDALTFLGKHFKLVGDSESDGVNKLANALADRLNAAKRGGAAGEIEDATIIEPDEDDPGQDGEDDDPGQADPVGQAGQAGHDGQAVEPTQPSQPSQDDVDEELW